PWIPPNCAGPLGFGAREQHAAAYSLHVPKLGQEKSRSKPRRNKRVQGSDRKKRCDFVGGYVQQLFSSGYQPRGARSSPGGRVQRHRPANASVLRKASVR